MGLQPIPLPGATVSFDPHWLAEVEADALFEHLLRELPWQMHRIRMFGRMVDSPRLSCWIGDLDARYRYSGTVFEPHPWPSVLLPVRARLQAMLRARSTDTCFNSVLANRYRTGHDGMGWHRDDEPELGVQPVIASLSLGASRRFVLKGGADAAHKLELILPHGSLLVMRGQTQALYRHALPKTARPVGERINLTFRRVVQSHRPVG